MMPRKSRPWFWSSRGKWATTIDGVRHTSPPEVETEHQAWEWHAALIESIRPKSTPRSAVKVWDVFEAHSAWDAEGVESGSRNKASAIVVRSCLQVIADTKIGHAKFGSLRASRVAPAHFDSLIAAWHRAGYKPSYVAMLAQTAKTVFRWATRDAVDRPPMIDRSPFHDRPAPTRPAAREKVGDRKTAALWLRYLWRSDHPGHRDDATFQRCLIHTGVRPSELAWATWGEVAWDAAGDGMAVITRTAWKNAKKTGRLRRIYIPTRLVRALKRRSQGKGAADYLYPRPSGGKHTSPSLSARAGWYRDKAIEAGVPLTDSGGRPITNYLWRHTAASTLLMNGVDVTTVAELLGTSVAEIQRTYGHLLADHLAAAAKKLGRRERA